MTERGKPTRACRPRPLPPPTHAGAHGGGKGGQGFIKKLYKITPKKSVRWELGNNAGNRNWRESCPRHCSQVSDWPRRSGGAFPLVLSGTDPGGSSDLHGQRLVHLEPHVLDAAQNLLLVPRQRHPYPQEVPGDRETEARSDNAHFTRGLCTGTPA